MLETMLVIVETTLPLLTSKSMVGLYFYLNPQRPNNDKLISQDPFPGSTTLPDSSALPVVFKREIQNQELQEEESVTLLCELSKPGVPVVWRKGTEVIHSGGKYVIKQVGTTVELKITDVKPEDAGDYACDCGDNICTANIKVNGRTHLLFEPSTTMKKFTVFWPKKLYFNDVLIWVRMWCGVWASQV